MNIESVELITLQMPLVTPFVTSFGRQTTRTPLLIRVTAWSGERRVVGWGECVALPRPVYSSEYLDGARHLLLTEFLPALRAAQDSGHDVTAEGFAALVDGVVGHRMAKASLEMALLDAQLQLDGRSFASWLGVSVTRVPSGVSVGIQDSIPVLLDVVENYLAQGYVRIKLKIAPGWDIDPVRAVRERFGDIPLQVDANTAYRLSDAPLLRRLDQFGLLLIEQPLADDDIRQHARMARLIDTPICLDESIVSAAAAVDAITIGAVGAINIKPGRVGGYLEARRIHDIAQASGVAAWCGGMLETGIGRAANIALAGLPGFTLPGDISASDRFFARDITDPVTLDAGHVAVPDGPGFGIEVDEETVADFLQERVRYTLG